MNDNPDPAEETRGTFVQYVSPPRMLSEETLSADARVYGDHQLLPGRIERPQYEGGHRIFWGVVLIFGIIVPAVATMVRLIKGAIGP